MEKVNSPLCLPFSRLSVVDTLGKGTFGSVQLVKEKTKGGVAALKTIPKESISKFMIEIQKQNVENNLDDNNKTLGTQALKEITAMKRVCTGQCSGIPRYVGDREDKNNYYILMDSVRGKSLRTIVSEIGPFTDINTIRSILAQILSTISFIHSHNVLHRDLSDNNILIQPNGTVKIIDFGCATLFDPNNIPECSPYTEYPEIDPDDINKKNIIGTLDFIAPEVLVDGCYSEKSDIWSFGVLLFYMVTGHYPFSDDEIDDVYETMYNILENTVVFYETDVIYEPLCDIFYLCCNPDIYSRVTIEELKNHEFFEGIDWNTITLPKSKKKPNLSIHTSLLKNNANAALLANSNNGMMGPTQIYIASPTCLNSPIRINSPSCLYTPLTCGLNTPPIEKTESPIINSTSAVVTSPLVKAATPLIAAKSPIHKSPLVRATSPKIVGSPKIKTSHLEYKNDTLLFSPKAAKIMAIANSLSNNNINNINNNNNITNHNNNNIKNNASSSNSISSTTTTTTTTSINNNNHMNNHMNKNINLNININSSNPKIINNISPKKLIPNRNFLNEDYINSPLQQQSTLYSPEKNKDKNVNNLDTMIESNKLSIITFPFKPSNHSEIENIDDKINLYNTNINTNYKKRNIIFSEKEIKKNNNSLNLNTQAKTKNINKLISKNNNNNTTNNYNKNKNEYISEVLLNNNNLNIEINNSKSSHENYHENRNLITTPSLLEIKKINHSSSSENVSDDETRSNCTLINDSEKEFNEQPSLIEDHTIILNNVVDTSIYEPTNSNIYKTWDSEHSHILTF